MKKLCAILLVAVMCLGLVPFAVSADEPTWTHTLEEGVLTITGEGVVTYAGADPAAAEAYPWTAQKDTVTEIVIGDGITEIGPRAFSYFSALTKVTFGKDCATLQQDVVSNCPELTTLIFNGPVSFIGQGVVYNSPKVANVTITNQAESNFKSVATAIAYNDAFKTATYTVIGDVVEDPEPERTWTWELKEGVLTVTGTGEIVADATGPYTGSYPWASEADSVTEVVVGDGITKIGAKAFTSFKNMTKATFGKDVTELGADVLSYAPALTDIVFGGPITVMGQGVVYSCTAIANVTITGQTVEEFEAVAKAKAYNYWDASENPAYLANATITVAGSEPIDPPVVKQDITIAPAFDAWENWVNSPNGNGKEPGVTQLLVAITDGNDVAVDIDVALTWKVTITAGDVSKTITLAPATKDLTYKLYRFETCLAKGENQFIPVAGTDYTVQISVYNGEDLAYESAAVAGFTCPEGLEPQTPPTPVWPDSLTLTPLYGIIENWNGGTFFIVGNEGAQFESNKDIHAKLKDGTYALKVIITDETDKKVYTIDKYMFDHTETGDKEFYSNASFLRIAVCDYGIVPATGHEYTVTYEITENGELRYNAASELGAFNSFNDGFKADGPIIPEEVPHTCTVADKPEEPTPTPTPEPTPSEEPTPTPSESKDPEPSESKDPESKPSTSKPAGGDDKDDEGGDNTGLIVGIVIAVVAVAAIVVVVVVLKKKKA